MKRTMKCIIILASTLAMMFGVSEISHSYMVLLDDNFDSENGGIAPNTIYSNFQNWVIETGTVDLCGSAYYSYHRMPSSAGLYVDLDGGGSVAPTGGKIISKTEFILSPGLYELRFDLSASVYGVNNLVNVSLDQFIIKTL